jgi:hypothetical protein
MKLEKAAWKECDRSEGVEGAPSGVDEGIGA